MYGFINIPDALVFDVMEHPYYQRLRRISQMGLSYLVYPGAKHSRFEHGLGCVYLMQKAVQTLRFKRISISPEEEQALYLAILLHDIGHGPFSHAMEHSIVEGISHERISLLFMQELNQIFEGKLSLAIQIFQKKYPRAFMNQLISSQLDIDRLDYLSRDSFYTGVAEGSINSERIIAMLNVKNDLLVVEEKGIYSVEKFLVARRLMYWQVYLHKASLGAEQVLIKVLKRAKELAQQGVSLPMPTALRFFVEHKVSEETFDVQALETFSQLDDYDIISAMKEWQNHPDEILSHLSKMILNRDLFRVKIRKFPPDKEEMKSLTDRLLKKYDLPPNQQDYFLFWQKISNTAYNKDKQNIFIYTKSGKIVDVAKASDQMNLEALSQRVSKYFLCYPKGI